MKIYHQAILPLGFKANGVCCGIKKSGKLDLALFYSQEKAKTANLFTVNKVQAACLKLNKIHLKRNKAFQAVIVNSGNANCFTGTPGFKDASQTAETLADYLGLKKEAVLVNSTGIIGKRLPVEKIKKAIPGLVNGLSLKGIAQAKRAILTTDNFTKEISVKFKLGKRQVTICGVAKGAGMIAPHMATMLCFIFSDALITQRALNKALKEAVDSSFNCITVDGCMSTNDTVTILANGQSANQLIDENKNFKTFSRAINLVCLELAKMVVRDAEGATKFIRINIRQAQNLEEARKAALAIANSTLFKCAMYGSSKNIFGRIVASLGAAGIEVKEDKFKIKFSSLKKKEITLDIFLGRGNFSLVTYTSDLTPKYVLINAEYN